jgi:hypothetical protein
MKGYAFRVIAEKSQVIVYSLIKHAKSNRRAFSGKKNHTCFIPGFVNRDAAGR